MRHPIARTAWIALATLAMLGCSSVTLPNKPETQAATPEPEPGRVEVFVQWNEQGVPDRQVEVVELGMEQTTDATGHTTFTLPPGNYTLRAHVNTPGPRDHRDVAVTVASGETEQVEVWDCLVCL